MATWISDANGNRCSVEYWGSEENAKKALDSLENCSGCSNCSDCSGCSRCSDCSGCSRCSDCSDCFGCSGCSDCPGFSPCSDSFRCFRCSDLENAAPVESRAEEIKIPVIPNIHKAVYEAASQPQALEMDTWH